MRDFCKRATCFHTRRLVVTWFLGRLIWSVTQSINDQWSVKDTSTDWLTDTESVYRVWCEVWTVCILHCFFLLKDQQINKLAGNSIAIPVAGAILAVLLASTRLPLDTTPEPGSDYQESLDLKPLPPQWIGAKCIAPAAGPFDSLFTEPARKNSGDAGTPKQKRQASMDHFVKKRKKIRWCGIDNSALSTEWRVLGWLLWLLLLSGWGLENNCVEIRISGKICSVLVHDDFKKI